MEQVEDSKKNKKLEPQNILKSLFQFYINEFENYLDKKKEKRKQNKRIRKRMRNILRRNIKKRKERTIENGKPISQKASINQNHSTQDVTDYMKNIKKFQEMFLDFLKENQDLKKIEQDRDFFPFKPILIKHVEEKEMKKFYTKTEDFIKIREEVIEKQAELDNNSRKIKKETPKQQSGQKINNNKNQKNDFQICQETVKKQSEWSDSPQNEINQQEQLELQNWCEQVYQYDLAAHYYEPQLE